MKRSELLTIIDAALAAGQVRYAREAAETLLAAWPGDLSGRMALARAQLASDQAMDALDLLEGIVAVDPERAEAHRALGELFRQSGRKDRAAEAFGAAQVVDGQGLPDGITPPAWTEPARAARKAIGGDDWYEAQTQAGQALQAGPDNPLPSLLSLLAVWRTGDLNLARPLAEGFHARWPGCVPFSLCLAECLLAENEAKAKQAAPAMQTKRAKATSAEARAIALLHEAGALDPAGEVAERYWGPTHAYRSLWPKSPDSELPGPLPKSVSSLLGMNLLSGQSTAHIRPPDEKDPAERPAAPPPPQYEMDEVTDILAELQRLEAGLKPVKKGAVNGAKKKETRPSAKPSQRAKAKDAPAAGHFSSPPPPLSTHLIVSSKSRLVRKYGAEQAEAVTNLLGELADASAQSTQSAVVVLFVDDRDGLRNFDLKPVNAEQPWDIKLLLQDTAAVIAKKGGLLTSILIAGGDDIIPFHHLPNPVDDGDSDVPSDNPYASPDDNYLVPEWAIGRLPAPAGKDAQAFIRLLKANIAAHRALATNKSGKNIPGLPGLLERITQWLASIVGGQDAPAVNLGHNFGYTARAWQVASTAVFAPIGDQKRLSTCPPLDVTGLPAEGLAPAALSYFNLHGVEDGPEWYGQREANDSRLPQYPIALRPANVANSGRAPGLVFSEACYGANIHDKQVDDALCLKFLDSGTRTVVASTKIAYGSIGTPLIGADLLGRLFWDYLKEGWPVGEALRQAKTAHAKDMHTRQGYLDGEDQKTLISFVLYGDPLLPSPIALKKKSGAARAKAAHAPRPSGADLILTSDETDADPGVSRPEAVAQIKNLVQRHLPGRDDWAVHISQQRRLSPGTAQAQPSSPNRAKSLGPKTGNMVFTLSKRLPIDTSSRRAMAQYVRVTVNSAGKVVKMAVSR